MSNSNQSSNASNVFFGAGLLVVFGFLVLILSNFATRESLEERAYKGDFDAATIESRWENLKSVTAEQAEKFDAEKVEKAMAAVSASKTKPAASGVVVPGSPTFMKQMEQASQEAAAEESASTESEESPSPEKVAPEAGETAPAAEEKPKSKKEKVKPAPEKKEGESKSAKKKPEPKPAPAATETPKSGGEKASGGAE